MQLSWQGVATHVDATQTEAAYKLRIDLLGFSPEEVDIELQGGKLTITAKKQEAKSGEGGSKSPQRRSTASFSRSFALPDNVREDDISASLDKGVLTVTLPKAEPAPKPKSVPVHAKGAEAPAATAEAEGPAAAQKPKRGRAAQGQCQCRGWGRCS